MLGIITALVVLNGFALVVWMSWELKNFQAIRQLYYEESREKRALGNIRGASEKAEVKNVS